MTSLNNELESNAREIIHWVMSKDAVASCFVKDVFSMSQNENGGGTHQLSFPISNSYQPLHVIGLPYYFLGRVPCRSVSLVAIVVGATAYERRVLYIRESHYLWQYHAIAHFTVDDGTGTIECAFRIDQDKPEGQTSEATSSAQEPKRILATTERHSPPLIPVGSVVKVQGRIHVKHNSREIQGESIGSFYVVSRSTGAF